LRWRGDTLALSDSWFRYLCDNKRGGGNEALRFACVLNREMAGTFLTAEWRKLVMAQYEVAPEVLEPWLPGGVELDFYEGRTYVSLVGFLFDRVKIKGVPPPFHTRFEEVNLRFYVKRVMPGGEVRRGVVFVSEIVAKPAITWMARALYGEAYSTARTRRRWDVGAEAMRVAYEWKVPGQWGGAWQHVSVEAGAAPVAIAAGSMEEFITEHYWGYTKGSGLLRREAGVTGEYGVAHPRWQCYEVRRAEVRADFGALYGEAFVGLSVRAPEHVLLAEGSKVAIRMGAVFR
jgi:uncharacterized protein YqjF (DUF2071 family)